MRIYARANVISLGFVVIGVDGVAFSKTLAKETCLSSLR